MTVQRLIALLQKMPSEAPVAIGEPRDGEGVRLVDQVVVVGSSLVHVEPSPGAILRRQVGSILNSPAAGKPGA